MLQTCSLHSLVPFIFFSFLFHFRSIVLFVYFTLLTCFLTGILKLIWSSGLAPCIPLTWDIRSVEVAGDVAGEGDDTASDVGARRCRVAGLV